MTTSKSLVRVAFALALFLSPAPAWAHARLTRSEPAAGSKVGSPPWIRLWFSERPEIALSSATLKDQSGKAFSLGAAQSAQGDPLQVSFALTGALPPGTYTLGWRTVPSDGHPSHGTFNFVVLAASPPTETQPQTGSAIAPVLSVGQSAEQANEAGSAINSLARAFSFAGILLVIGVTVFNLLVVARSDRIGSELVGRMESRAAVVGIAASLWVILGAFTQLYLESRMMSQMPGMQTMSIADMAMHTRWGFAMRLEIISAFLALVSFAVAVKRVRDAWL